MKESCIEVMRIGGGPKRVSVREYVATAKRASGFSPAKRPHDIDWATFAPPVEKLTLEYQQPGFNLPRFRICHWDVYDAQMRELLGLV
jgi:hypothetical protein